MKVMIKVDFDEVLYNSLVSLAKRHGYETLDEWFAVLIMEDEKKQQESRFKK